MFREKKKCKKREKRKHIILICTSTQLISGDFSERRGSNRLGRGQPSGEVPQRIFIIVVEPVFKIQRIAEWVVPKLSRSVSFVPAVTAENRQALILDLIF